MRDDFSSKTKEILAKRVAFRCSNPDCRKLTCGPRTEPDKTVNIGVAAHITAAAPNGPRYESGLSDEQRKAATNGIWLCQNCAKLIDNDTLSYPTFLLERWKVQAELEAKTQIEVSGSFRKSSQSGLAVQTTTISRVPFSMLLPFPDGLDDAGKAELFRETTRVLFNMIACAYLDAETTMKRSKFVFGLTLEQDIREDEIEIHGELISHLTPFAYQFATFVALVNEGRIEELLMRIDSYPQFGIRRQFKFGKFLPYRISRTNPSKVFIELIEETHYKFEGGMSTSDLILYFSAAVNGKLVVHDDVNDGPLLEKSVRLSTIMQDGFDLTEVWIDPSDPEKWELN